MSPCIIDALEMVQVDKQNRAGGLRSFATSQFFIDATHHSTMVWQACDCIRYSGLRLLSIEAINFSKEFLLLLNKDFLVLMRFLHLLVCGL